MEMIKRESVIAYLQSLLNNFKADEAKFGMDKATIAKFDAMIACKEMTEVLLQEPVNLGKDGKVTVGF